MMYPSDGDWQSKVRMLHTCRIASCTSLPNNLTENSFWQFSCFALFSGEFEFFELFNTFRISHRDRCTRLAIALCNSPSSDSAFITPCSSDEKCAFLPIRVVYLRIWLCIVAVSFFQVGKSAAAFLSASGMQCALFNLIGFILVSYETSGHILETDCFLAAC